MQVGIDWNRIDFEYTIFGVKKRAIVRYITEPNLRLIRGTWYGTDEDFDPNRLPKESLLKAIREQEARGVAV